MHESRRQLLLQGSSDGLTVRVTEDMGRSVFSTREFKKGQKLHIWVKSNDHRQYICSGEILCVLPL